MNSIFRGKVKDLLESRFLYLYKHIQYGVIDENELFEDFSGSVLSVNFQSPIDIIRVEEGINVYYIFKFPIDGDLSLIEYKPSESYISIPDFIIRNNEMWIRIEENNLETMKVMISGIIETLKIHIEDINKDILEYNNDLRNQIQKLINIRNRSVGKDDEKSQELFSYILFEN